MFTLTLRHNGVLLFIEFVFRFFTLFFQELRKQVAPLLKSFQGEVSNINTAQINLTNQANIDINTIIYYSNKIIIGYIQTKLILSQSFHNV